MRVGDGEGSGANLNLPLDPGTGDEEWLGAVGRLASFGDGSRSMVVSLGVDAWKDDPESPLQVSVDGYTRAGSLLGQMGIPTVIVQEGGLRPRGPRRSSGRVSRRVPTRVIMPRA